MSIVDMRDGGSATYATYATIVQIFTAANKAFELGNFLLRIRPD